MVEKVVEEVTFEVWGIQLETWNSSQQWEHRQSSNTMSSFALLAHDAYLTPHSS